MKRPTCFLGVLASVLAAIQVAAQHSAPSSHFVFDDAFEGDILVHEVRVPRVGETQATYYETLGWQGLAAGYAGIQAHPNGHNYIFSIWDNPRHQGPIVAVHHGPGTKTESFGGEGTGLKSWNFELGWETDVWYTLVARCWPQGTDTFHGFWARSAETGVWTHLVTMKVAVENAFYQGGTDAFIEDWLATGDQARTIHLRNGWKRRRDGSWYAFGSGRYSVNTWDLAEGKRSFHHRTHWNGGVDKDGEGAFYFMVSGGTETRPTTEVPAVFSIERTGSQPAYAPLTVESVKGRAEENRAVISWTLDPATAPQFRYAVEIHENPFGKGTPLARTEAIDPAGREATLEVPRTQERIFFFLRLEDLFGREIVVPVGR